MPSRWHIIAPFQVTSFRKFFDAAKAAGFWDLFKSNQAGYVFCVDPHRSDHDRPGLDSAYELMRRFLPPREYALFRIEEWKEEDLGGRNGIATFDHQVRYERVYRDRVEPTVYSDDPAGKRQVKRDWDVIRAVMLRVEDGDGMKEVSSGDFKPTDEALVAYNMYLLREAGLAEGGGRELGSVNAGPHQWIDRLTWQGHELLDKIRGEPLWTRIKEVAKEKGVDLTIDSIKGLAKIALDQLLSR